MEKITYGFFDTPMGEMVIGSSDKGLCWLGFMVDGYKGDGFSRMKAHFKSAEFVRDDNEIADIGFVILNAWEKGEENLIPVDLRGTTFQKSVWQALLDIRRGEVKSYGDVANDLGMPKAARAVGSAVGENPVSLIVPCHRVLQKSGAIGNYGWGVDLKRQILCEEGIAV
ncbi:MAG: methylated-DNA--[protein]-cysteine S-methyltransferase [Alphaproteobacteria bacterium]